MRRKLQQVHENLITPHRDRGGRVSRRARVTRELPQNKGPKERVNPRCHIGLVFLGFSVSSNTPCTFFFLNTPYTYNNGIQNVHTWFICITAWSPVVSDFFLALNAFSTTTTGNSFFGTKLLGNSIGKDLGNTTQAHHYYTPPRQKKQRIDGPQRARNDAKG